MRGLGRSPSKLSDELRSNLEGFVKSSSHYDIPALDKACSGVDAVICAYMGIPELALEGNLMLLRAAERAGVRRFVPESWNYDWRGEHYSGDRKSDGGLIDGITFVSSSGEVTTLYLHWVLGLADTIYDLHLQKGI